MRMPECLSEGDRQLTEQPGGKCFQIFLEIHTPGQEVCQVTIKQSNAVEIYQISRQVDLNLGVSHSFIDVH